MGGTAEWYVADEHALNQKIVGCKMGALDRETAEKWMHKLTALLKEYTELPVSISCAPNLI